MSEQGTPAPPRPLGAGGLVFIAFLQLVGFLLVFGLGASLTGDASSLAINAGAAAVVAPLLALMVALLRHAPDEPMQLAVGLVAPSGPGRGVPALVLAAVLGVALAPLADALTAAIFALFPMEQPEDPTTALSLAQLEPKAIVVAFLTMSVLGPIVNELLYRGVLSRKLLLRGPRGALVIAVVYGGVQLNPRLALAAVGLSLALSLSAWAGRSVWPAVIGALAFQLAPLALGADPIVEAAVLSPAGLATSGAAVALCALGLWRLGRRAHAH